ncbi:MAG TPA: glycoside hydrolase family 2 TIM barrel-domain containing protein [Pyrinomonadaceae bacterium]|nr:glycoside hydrolase family 2 TIM barrel-domain containing protein [Pyrinomonadaceae bacterium]
MKRRTRARSSKGHGTRVQRSIFIRRRATVVLTLVLLALACMPFGAMTADRTAASSPTPATSPPANTPGSQAQGDEMGMVLFDADWRFFRGGAQGAEGADFDDSRWRTVDLPHDWSIEDLPGKQSPFDPQAISQVSGGFTVGGTGWYRKTFDVPESQRGKRIRIQFDGVYMNAEVWLNGQRVGEHPYGYTSFWFDLTDKIKFGGANVLAVKVKNEGENSRWYSGSGLYRHVWLKTLDPVHVAQWGTYVTTPDVSASEAKVVIRTRVENEGDTAARVRLVTRLLNASGMEAMPRTDAGGFPEAEGVVEAKGSREFETRITLTSPMLWSPESPSLHTAFSEVYREGQMVHVAVTKFGVRSISFDAHDGFRLNGQPLRLKGGCLHHDNGPLGARAYDRAEERRVELLKAAGFNALRMAHNPPSPAFLEACDRLGMLVIDEAFDMWREGKNPHDYHLFFDEWWRRDVESMIERDRNHPSIILWSIGNEIPDRRNPEVVKTAKTLADYVRKLEPTRPVTSAVNNLRDQQDPFFAALDVAGYNYAAGGDHMQESLYVLDHKRVPGRVMVGTESYPLEAFDAWMSTLQDPSVIGDFVWTAFDYIGEASIGWRGYWQESNFYPWTLAYCGDIDICGWKRPQSFYRDALWKDDQLSLFVKPPRPSFEPNPKRQSWSKWHWDDVVSDWNWRGYEGKTFEVNVYSSCEEVELFLNGKSLGRQRTSFATRYRAAWQVPYQPGTLRAVGRRGSREVNSAELRTAGEPAQIKLSADRVNIKADGQDLSYVTVELVDARGDRNPKAANLVEFTIQGPGAIIGVGNANPVSTESYQQPRRKAWQGRCLAVVKSDGRPGQIVLKASARGLSPGTVVINAGSR